jgi:hypothetical protein
LLIEIVAHGLDHRVGLGAGPCVVKCSRGKGPQRVAATLPTLAAVSKSAC